MGKGNVGSEGGGRVCDQRMTLPSFCFRRTILPRISGWMEVAGKLSEATQTVQRRMARGQGRHREVAGRSERHHQGSAKEGGQGTVTASGCCSSGD